jgi:hypothetical protein
MVLRFCTMAARWNSSRAPRRHTTRAALTGLRKRGYKLERTRSEKGGPSPYRILDGSANSRVA